MATTKHAIKPTEKAGTSRGHENIVSTESEQSKGQKRRDRKPRQIKTIIM